MRIGLTHKLLICLPLIIMALTSTGCKTSGWQHAKKLDGFYDRMAEKILNNEPIIISVYAGLWNDGKPPESNFHWGSRFGIYSMFDRAKNDKKISQQYLNANWRKIYFEVQHEDPVRIAVFENRIQPNKFWSEKGVDRAFSIYSVFMAYENLFDAGSELAENLGYGHASKLTLQDGTELDLGESIAAGYNGHNYYYEIMYRLRSWGFVPKIKKRPDEVKGVFVICCHSKTEYRKYFIDENIFALALTTSRMAPEGYNLLALFDGISLGLNGKDLKDKMDQSYRYFQVLGGNSPPGPLFVNHEVGLF